MSDQQIFSRALEMAAFAHRDQERRDGTPYILHPVRVGLRLYQKHGDVLLASAGLLHDWLEDQRDRVSEYDALHVWHIPARVVEIVRIVSRLDPRPPDGPSYAEWIDEIIATGDRAALRVKLADLLDNMMDNPDDDMQEMIARRYRPASQKVAFALADMEAP